MMTNGAGGLGVGAKRVSDRGLFSHGVADYIGNDR